MKVKIASEYLILIHCLEELEREGHPAGAVFFSFDEDELKKVNERFALNYSVDGWNRVINKCMTNSWLSYRAIGDKYFHNMKITDQGLGIARSKRRELAELQSKTWLMKISDSAQRHSGLIALLALLVSIGAMIISLVK